MTTMTNNQMMRNGTGSIQYVYHIYKEAVPATATPTATSTPVRDETTAVSSTPSTSISTAPMTTVTGPRVSTQQVLPGTPYSSTSTSTLATTPIHSHTSTPSA